MPEWWYDGRRSDDEMYAFASLEWEENQRRKREEQQKVYGSTAERAAGLSPEQLAQADRILKEAREHFHEGLDALNNLMHTLPPEQQVVLQQSVMPSFETAAYKLQDTKDAITPQ
mgnify:FL=1